MLCRCDTALDCAFRSDPLGLGNVVCISAKPQQPLLVVADCVVDESGSRPQGAGLALIALSRYYELEFALRAKGLGVVVLVAVG